MSIVNITDGEAASSVRTKLNSTIDRANQLTLTASVTRTVGAGGNHPTINSALVYFTNRRPIHATTPIVGTIHLLAGFQMAEQVLVNGVDLGWIRITGADSITTVVRSALTINFTSAIFGFNSFPAFGVRNGGSLPVIQHVFQMNTSGIGTTRDGVIIIGAGSRSTFADDAGFNNGGGHNVAVLEGAMFTAQNCEFKDAVRSNLNVGNNARANVNTSVLTGAGDNGVFCNRASIVSVRNANCQKGGSPSVDDIKILQGGIISANDSTGGTSETVNTITANGIIFK